MGVLSMLAVAALSLQTTAGAWADRHVAAANPTNGLSRFVGYPQSFRPNPSFWLKDVDFSCASPWNSATGRLRAGTAISRRHIVFAKHFPLSKGCRILFIDGQGETCPCYLEKVQPIEKTDIAVGLLNAELTPNIVHAKLLPADAEERLGDLRGLPVVTLNQNEEAVLNQVGEVPDPELASARFRGEPSKDERRNLFRKTLITGDSGSPTFLLIDKTPVLLYCLLGGGSGSGYALHKYRREIQSAMDALCPGYALETYDFGSLGR